MKRREFLAAAAGSSLLLADNKRIRVGCHTSAWKIEVPEFRNLLRVVTEAKALGYEGFETDYRNVQGQFENLKEARAAIEATGMRFFGCHIFQYDYDPKTNIPAFELIKRIAEGASKMGAEHLIVSGAPVADDPDRLRWKTGALNRAGRLCRDLKFERLCYHNHAADAAEMATLVKETDGETVRFVLDNPDLAFFAKHQKRVEGLHVHAGVDATALAAAVKKVNWQGWVIAEEEMSTGSMDAARASIRQTFGA